MEELTAADSPRAVPPRSRAERVLLVELDGADYQVLVPMAASGVMPNLASLLQSAALVRLEQHAPWCDSAAWSTLRTGNSPAAHGRLDDYFYDHQRRRLVPAVFQPMGCPTLDEHLTHVDPQIPALRVGDEGPCVSIWARQPETLGELDAGLRRLEAQLQRRLIEAQQADAGSDWRLLTVRIEMLDSITHRLWNLLGVGVGPGGCPSWIARTRQAFAALDHCLGDLIALAQRRKAALMLASPTGFTPFRERIAVAELLRRHELLAPAAWKYQVVRQALRLAGRWSDNLSRLGRRTPARLRTVRPWIGSLSVDWRSSRAVVLHGQAAAMVYLNTRQRFGSRVLRTRRQHDQAATDVLWALEDARHPATGERLFEQVYLTFERFNCDPLARNWPEIVAIPAQGFHAWPLFTRRPQVLRTEPGLTATHTGQGLWIVQAPGVVLGRPYHARLVDVAPSILDLLGQAPAPGMAGRAIRELFEPAPQIALESRLSVV